MARTITFPKVHVRHWTNAETGVTIEQGSYLDPLRYKVHVPSQTESGWSTAAEKATLAEARAAAKDVAEGMRAQIARAHREALVEFAIVMADRAEAAITAATNEEALSGEEADLLFGYLTTAKLFRETDPERSIGWSNEILTATDAAADRETEAAKVLDTSTPLARSVVEADHAEALRTEVTREQAHAAWGRVWAGRVPAGLVDAFKTGDYATALRLAEEQIARQEERSPRSHAPQLDGGRPAHWGTAWLEVKHPAHIDMITQSTALDSVAYLRFAAEPQRGRFFPGPM